MDIKAVIFDMDGVLIDSEPQYQKELIACLKEQNINVSLDELKPLAGGTESHFEEILTPLLGKSGLSIETFYDYLDVYTASHPFHYSSILNQGIHATLSTLKQHGIILALASSSPPENIARVLKECELTDFFEFTISGELFKESKPHPEIYLTAIQKLGLPLENVIAVEDSTYGIQSAKAAGLFCVAKYDDRFDYHQERADFIIHEIPDILALLKERKTMK